MMRLKQIYEELERPLWPILADMETTGIAIDTTALETAQEKATVQLESSAAVLESAGITNPNSTAQLRRSLYGDLALGPPAYTASGLPATDADSIALLLARDLTTNQRAVVSALDDYREVSKLLSTYIIPLPEFARRDGRVHTSFNQRVETGRLSSSKPNLQNIPARTELGRAVRRAFVAGPGRVLVKADYSQLELRVMAALSKDQSFVRAYTADPPLDLHSLTSRQLFGDEEPHHRRIAKTANFGVGYGASGRRLSLLLLKESGMVVPADEARAIIDRWWKAYPGVKDWREAEWRKIVRRGYTQTYYGRRNYIPPLDPEDWGAVEAAKREALNMPIQGTGADVVKQAMIAMAPRLKALGVSLMLQVHDEVVIETPPELVEDVARVIHSSGPPDLLGIPLPWDVGTGPNWVDMVKVKV